MYRRQSQAQSPVKLFAPWDMFSVEKDAQVGDIHPRGRQRPAATPELQQSSGQRQRPQRGSSAPPQSGLSGPRLCRPQRGLRRLRCRPVWAQESAGHGRCMDCQTPPSVQGPTGHKVLRLWPHQSHVNRKNHLQTTAAAHLQPCCAQPCMAYATVCHRDDTWTAGGLGSYLEHFEGPWLPDGAQGLPQLHVDVHRAGLRRDGVPVGGVDGGEGHARRGGCAWRGHVERPARVAAKDLHLGPHTSSQSQWSSRRRGCMLLIWPQMAQEAGQPLLQCRLRPIIDATGL